VTDEYDDLKIVTFSNLYPNVVSPRHGIFVEQRLLQIVGSGQVEAKVVAPVPWFPFNSEYFGGYARFARIPSADSRNGIDIVYPRYFQIPKVGMSVAPLLMAGSLYGMLRRLRQEFGAFVIDAHFLYPDGVAASLLGRWLGLPVVLTARGSDVTLFGRYAAPRAWIRWATACATRVVTVSESLRSDLIDLGVAPDHVVTLRNGVSLQRFQPLSRQVSRKHIGVGGPLLLSVGNLIDLKGHDLVIRAIVDLPDVQLVIVGAGPAEKKLRRMAANLGIAARIMFTGNVANEDLVHYYNAADALVLASEREGMPNVVLESLACATPVIATKVGGIPEIVKTSAAGILLEERTPDAIVAAFRSLRSSPPARTATRAVAETLGWEPTVNGLLEVLDQAVRLGGLAPSST
jgi:glycosyltransferase involved in cell wall biosynthesis